MTNPFVPLPVFGRGRNVHTVPRRSPPRISFVQNAFYEKLKRTGDLSGAISDYIAMADGMPPYIPGAKMFGDLPRWDGRHVRHLVLVTQFPLWPRAAHGEAIQFGRYAVEARRRCERLTLAVHPGIQALLKRVLQADDTCDVDEFCNVGADSYATFAFDLTSAVGQVHGEPLRIPALPECVPQLDPRKWHFGVRWAGSQGPSDFRAIPLAALEPLRRLRCVELHSLQVESAAERTPPWLTRHDLSSWDRTAGLVSALDAVITPDTSIAHLSASMGRRTHVVLGDRFGCWRWGRGPETPWYPGTVKVWRGDPLASINSITLELAGDMHSAAGSSLPAVDVASLGAVPLRQVGKPLYMSGSDLQALLALCRGAKRIVEVGVQMGNTARFLLANLTSIEQYTGIDVAPGYKFATTNQSSEIPRTPGALAAADKRFRLIVRPRGTFDLTPADIGPADLVFVDGDHGRDAVLHDTNLAREILRPGGMIVWHDVGNKTAPAVRECLEEMHTAGRDIRHVSGTWLAFEVAA